MATRLARLSRRVLRGALVAVALPALLGPVHVAAAAPAKAATVASGPATGTAQASAVPAAPDFPHWLDPVPHYEAETGCSPVATPGALDVVRILRATYGPSYAANIVRPCSAKDSGHEEGRAVDWMTSARVPAQKADGDAFVAWLLADDVQGRHDVMARRLGVMYVIWDSRFYPVYDRAPAWREYSDCLRVRTSAKDDTDCHRNHIHVSLTHEGAAEETSWWTLGGGAPDCTDPTRTLRARTLAVAPGAALVRTTAATVLDTEAGIGTPHVPLPCTVQAGRRLTATVTGRVGAPVGAAAVRVRVSASGAAAATWVSLSSAGGVQAPAARRFAVPAGSAVARTYTVALGATGQVSVDVGPAAADLRLQVVGYVPATSSGGTDRPVVPAAPGGADGRVGRPVP